MSRDEPPSDDTDVDAPEESAYRDELRDHPGFDGIHEYDNPSPRWLTSIFVATIVWSVIYVLGMALDFMPNYDQTLEDSMEEIRRRRLTAEGDREPVDVETLESALSDDDLLAAGEEVYRSKCAKCHGDAGGGEIGPNLTDDYWLHEGSLKAIYDTIENGVSGKGMPSWGSRLDRNEMVGVVAYVRSLRGTDPPDPKKPEGDEWTPPDSD